MSTQARIVNTSSGIQVVKGSINENAGFFTAITTAYTNLVHRPIVLILGTFLALEYLAIESKLETPLNQINDKLNQIMNSTESAQWEIALAGYISFVARFLMTFETRLVMVGFAWLPYLAKPSSNSGIISLIHSLIGFIARDWHTFTYILIANFHLVFVSVRNPIHKTAILILGIIVIYVGVEVGGKSILPTNTKDKSKPHTLFDVLTPSGG